jgi:acetyl esterase/lipase
MKHIVFCFCTFLLVFAVSPVIQAQTESMDAAVWTSQLWTQYRVAPNIVYGTANNVETKLDVYTRRDATGPVPTVIHIHGGGWVGGMKESDVPLFFPYLEMGWAVVNVEYRLGRVSLAPAAVEDCRCALRWVLKNAKEYNFDTTKIMVTGFSAGGHLSLTTGMVPSSSGLDRQCNVVDSLHVAAIVNWYGITDVGDLLEGPNQKNYAVLWMGSQIDRYDIAKRVSPLTYVRPGLPAIMTIHGDADPVVPYSHATRLHDALTKANSPNKLLTIPGGKHGGFTRDQMIMIYRTIREFLAVYGFKRQ